MEGYWEGQYGGGCAVDPLEEVHCEDTLTISAIKGDIDVEGGGEHIMDIGLTDCPVDVCKTALTLPGDEQSTESVEEEFQDQSPVRARQQNSLMG